MDLYTQPFTQPGTAPNPIVKQTITLANEVVNFEYECADGGKMSWLLDLNQVRARPDFRNHSCFVMLHDGSISNLWEDVVKKGVKNTDFLKNGYVASVVAHDNPKENPVLSMVVNSPTGVTPELVGNLSFVGTTEFCQHPLGSTNTNP